MCETLGKCLIIAVNVGFMILGVAMVIAGALLQWGGDFVNQYITPTLSVLAFGAQEGGAAKESVTISDLNALFGQYMQVLGSAGLIILIIGAVLFAISFCGICGVCQKSKILLGIYIACTIIIFVVMIIFVILFFAKRTELQEFGRQQFGFVIRKEYQGIHQTSGVSRIIDLIQARLSCCGVSNYTDFYAAEKWNRTYVINYNNQTEKVVELVAPVSCCKMDSPYSFTPKNINCTYEPDNSTSNWETGCYTKLWDLVDQYSLYVSYALIALCVFLLALIIIAIIVIKKFAKDALTPL